MERTNRTEERVTYVFQRLMPRRNESQTIDSPATLSGKTWAPGTRFFGREARLKKTLETTENTENTEVFCFPRVSRCVLVVKSFYFIKEEVMRPESN